MLSRFEDDKHISTSFEDLWEENSSSERVTLQLYLAEIVVLLCDCLASSSWANKRKVISFFYVHKGWTFPVHCHVVKVIVIDHSFYYLVSYIWQSAKAIRKLSEILGESLSPYHHNLLKCLLKELPGRFWEVCIWMKLWRPCHGFPTICICMFTTFCNGFFFIWIVCVVWKIYVWMVNMD